LVFDGFFSTFFFCHRLSCVVGYNNNLSSDLSSSQKSFQDNSFSGAVSGSIASAKAKKKIKIIIDEKKNLIKIVCKVEISWQRGRQVKKLNS